VITALITGACGGIGSVLCREFRRAPFYVVGIDTKNASPDVDEFIQADLARFSSEKNYRDGVLSDIRCKLPDERLTVLVNNAAVQILGGTEQLTEEAWRNTFDVNVLAPFLLAQQLLPALERAQGSVINIGSIHATLTKPGFLCYATSKAALVALTRGLAVDLGGRVRVNAICPGAIQTPMLERGFVGAPQAYAQLAAVHPAGRVGTPEEVARCALFLSDTASMFLTGAVIGLDGGIAARLHDPV
jgi:NAD(P)-dependent dehydrogenase (short-subunit alcohol dehydrogenase family)